MRKMLLIVLNTVALLGIASLALAAGLDPMAMGYSNLAAALGIGIAAYRQKDRNHKLNQRAQNFPLREVICCIHASSSHKKTG